MIRSLSRSIINYQKSKENVWTITLSNKPLVNLEQQLSNKSTILKELYKNYICFWNLIRNNWWRTWIIGFRNILNCIRSKKKKEKKIISISIFFKNSLKNWTEFRKVLTNLLKKDSFKITNFSHSFKSPKLTSTNWKLGFQKISKEAAWPFIARPKPAWRQAVVSEWSS